MAGFVDDEQAIVRAVALRHCSGSAPLLLPASVPGGLERGHDAGDSVRQRTGDGAAASRGMAAAAKREGDLADVEAGLGAEAAFDDWIVRRHVVAP